MGTLYLTQDPFAILDKLQTPNLRIFETDEFKIAQAQEVIREAYIFEQDGKTIAIASKIFNIEAQNALLKILEEPPKGVEFLLFTANKNALLPTVRSRMQIQNHIHKTPLVPLELDIEHLSLNSIYLFLKNLDSLPRSEGQELIQRLLKNIQKSHFKLSQEELELFDTAIRANLHYERLQINLLPILLSLLDRR